MGCTSMYQLFARLFVFKKFSRYVNTVISSAVMSLPECFADAEAYFRAAVDFLQKYSWIYRHANTSCLKSLEEMPSSFKNYFLNLSNDCLNAFPFIHKQLDNCPEEMLRFRQQIAELTPKPIAASAPPPASYTVQTQRSNCKMAPKKLHEIQQLAAHINGHCPDTKLIIDLGSGLGYLSEALLKLNANYRILGLEADEKRVQTARQRSHELLLPKEKCNAISYQQLFITEEASCCARIEELVAGLSDNSGAEMAAAIIGLHACADLSISALRLFVAMPQVRCLHIMPCCYHKLALSGDLNRPFRNFPLSSHLRAVILGVEPDCFHRPFMRLACQQTKSRWQCDADAHAKHGRQMFRRALAEALCDADECAKVRSQPSTHDLGPEELLSFAEFQHRFQLHSRSTGQPLPWRPIHKTRFQTFCEVYAQGRGAQLAEALCCLQTSIQVLCENLVLYDRLSYLEEVAAVQQLRLQARYEKLFDDKLSPRCHVLIAQKL